MFCGSCMHDNTLARAMREIDVDIVLTPTYTPIRTDEEDVSIDRVFFGGINVYLQQKIPLFRYLPAFVDRFLDRPWLIRMATARATGANAKELGALTVSMLKGRAGNQRKEVNRLIRWLQGPERPDVVNFSNMLIAGCAPAIKESLGVPLVVTLQGDDIFLEDLPEPHRGKCLELIRSLVPSIDAFIVNSRYYGDYMGDQFSIPADKLHVVPLGLDTDDFAGLEPRPSREHPTIGYLARLAPEKGLHVLIDAFIELHEMGNHPRARLQIAGWLGDHNRSYVDELMKRIDSAGLSELCQYVGSVDRAEKIDFLRSIDVLSVPTVYREPKGLFVLESLAAGVPVVQPDHGAFPEMIARLRGGAMVPPADPISLARALDELLSDDDKRLNLATDGHQRVHQHHNAREMAQATRDVWRSVLP